MQCSGAHFHPLAPFGDGRAQAQPVRGSRQQPGVGDGQYPEFRMFVLERELPRLNEGDRGVMLGFGPGLTLEGAAFTRGPAAVPTLTSPADAAAEA